MNRFIIPLPIRRVGRAARLAAFVAGGLIGAVGIAGCGTGQLSQMTTQVPAVNGSYAVVENVALRNIHIQAAQTGDFLQPGQSVDLVLVATNQSPDSADKLVGVTTDIGTVTLSGDATLPPGGTLFVGAAEGQNTKDIKHVEAAKTAKATVALNKPISNGLTYNFTFNFEKAGSTSVGVPISAGPAPHNSEAAAPVEHP